MNELKTSFVTASRQCIQCIEDIDTYIFREAVKNVQGASLAPNSRKIVPITVDTPPKESLKDVSMRTSHSQGASEDNVMEVPI